MLLTAIIIITIHVGFCSFPFREDGALQSGQNHFSAALPKVLKGLPGDLALVHLQRR